MRLINRYIGGSTIHAALFVTLALAGLEFFLTLSREIGDIGHGQYGFVQAIIYVALSVPQVVYNMFPMAILLGGLIGLGNLASRSEIIAMTAAGISTLEIVGAVIRSVFMMIVVVFLLGETVIPMARHYAVTQKTLATTQGQALKTTEGAWIRDGNNYIHIERVGPDKHFEGITRYEFDDQHRLKRVSLAKRGRYQHQAWSVESVQVSDIGESYVRTSKRSRDRWMLDFNPNFLTEDLSDLAEISLSRLRKFITSREQNNLQTGQYDFMFWQRVLKPLAALVMSWLALPFIFGSLRTTPIGIRIMTGVAIGFTFHLLNEFLGPLSLLYQFPPVIAALFPILLFATLGLWGVKRANQSG